MASRLMSYLVRSLGLMALLAAGGCAGLGFMPAEAVTTLKNPTHVEAYRTGKLDDHPGYGGKMDGFAVIRTGEASEDVARDLAEAIQDPTLYRDATRDQDFVPTVGYRFYRKLSGGRGQMSLDILVGFDCDEILLVAHDNKLRENFRRLLEVDPGRERLLDLTRQAFPFDELVQSLSPVRTPATEPDE
jgi:hypothetical protein